MIPNTPPTALDRILLYFRQLVRAEFPRLAFLGFYEYAVQSVNPDGSCALSPTDTSLNLPGSSSVPLRLSCATATLTPGSLVILFFVNGDPSRPAIIGGAPTPTNQTIDASALLKLGPSALTVSIAGGLAPQAAARFGDNVVAGPFGGTITGPCSLKTFIG